jgi:hypothetical protein
MDPSIKLSRKMAPQSLEEKIHMSKIPYRTIVCSLLYVVSFTRPDLASSVGIVCRFMDNPGKPHWEAVKRILKYIQGTLNHGLILGGTAPLTLRCYSDSDWAGCPDTRRSTTGYITLLGTSPISWKSKVQPTVALSSTEAEYMALAMATQEIMWLRQLLTDINLPPTSPTTIYEDNQGCIALTVGSKHHDRTKHIDTRYHFIREQIELKAIRVIYMQTDQMLADMLTKPLKGIKFNQHASQVTRAFVADVA